MKDAENGQSKDPEVESRGIEEKSRKTVENRVPTIPKGELVARKRISAGIKKILKPIETLKERDAVVADTRLLITDMLCDVLFGSVTTIVENRCRQDDKSP